MNILYHHIQSGNLHVQSFCSFHSNSLVRIVYIVCKIYAVSSRTDIGVLTKIDHFPLFGYSVEIHSLLLQKHFFLTPLSDFLQRGAISFTSERIFILPVYQLSDIQNTVTRHICRNTVKDTYHFIIDDEYPEFPSRYELLYKHRVVMLKGYLQGCLEVRFIIVVLQYGYTQSEIGGLRLDYHRFPCIQAVVCHTCLR